MMPYFLNNLNYDINSKKEVTDISIDRFHPPNINFTREIGYDSHLNNQVYGHFIDDITDIQTPENNQVDNKNIYIPKNNLSNYYPV